jgi:hypothetical protein
MRELLLRAKHLFVAAIGPLYALGPRTRPLPRPLARGRSSTSLEKSNIGIAIGESKGA